MLASLESFWIIIEELDGVISAESSTRLRDHLMTLDEAAVLNFADCLQQLVDAFDTRHQGQQVRDVNDPAASESTPLAGDGYEALKYAVIASGRETYSEVLREPSRLAGTWDFSEGLRLPEAAAQAYEQFTGDYLNAIVTEPTGETGILFVGGDFDDPSGASSNDEHAKAVFDLFEKIQESRQWQDWWRTCDHRPLLIVSYIGDVHEAKLRKGRREVWLELTRPRRPEALGAPSVFAHKHAEVGFEVLTRRLATAPHPQLALL